MKKKLLLYGFVLSVLLLGIKANATIRYAKIGSAGTAPYTSWATASNDLQAIINQCIAGDEIWIATGTYKPNRRADALTVITTTDRNDAFVLKNDVKIYGGFTGIETLLSQRNSTANVVTLSGDIGTAGVNTDNCYHVVIIANNASANTLLDGVSIVLGNANALAAVLSITVNTYTINPRYGGGIYKVSSNTDITNCVIRRNNASLSGAGIYETLSAATSVYTNCSITQNVSATDGGGMYVLTSSCLFQSCSFTSNDAAGNGAGMYLSGTGSSAFTTCNISTNDAVLGGGGIHLTGSGSPDFDDCTINNNTAGSNGAGITNRSTGSVSFSFVIFTGNISGADGGAMYNNTSTVSISSCQINSNQANGNGGGISNVNTNATIRNCKFENNTSLTAIGGGVFHSGGYLLNTYSIYSGNQATATSALYLNNNDAIIMNCLFSGNKSTGNQPAIKLQLSNNITMTGCTIAGNKKQTGTTGSAFEIATGCALTLTNCIVWGNEGSTPGASPFTLAGGTLTVTYSLIQFGYAGAGNISTNPLFINPIAAIDAPTSTGNYRLLKCSPAVNTGSNAAVVPPGSLSDLDLNSRVEYTTVDMGAYEKHLAIPDANGIVYVNSANTLNAADGSSWDKAVTELADALQAARTNTSINEIWVAKGTYKPLFNPTANLLTICTADNSNNTFLLVKDVKVYGGFAGGETDTTGRDFVANESILSGDIGVVDDWDDNCNHVLLSSGAVGTAELNGFRITKGFAFSGVDIIVNSQVVKSYYGSGILNTYSSPKIKNCIFSFNWGMKGGGISNVSSAPTITNCVFSNNAGDDGSGIYNTSSSPAISNCTFTQNWANVTGAGIANVISSSPIITHCTFLTNEVLYIGGAGIFNEASTCTVNNCVFIKNIALDTLAFPANGGAIYSYSSSLTITNSTFSGNNASGAEGGGIRILGGSMGLKNSIVWGNTALTGNNIYSTGAVDVLTNCIVEGGYAGTNVYNLDPLFVDTLMNNYRLQACSPALNIGNNADAATITDLDESPRIAYTSVDLGAYEKQTIDLTNSTWKGINTNWNDKINWCGGYIPIATTNVIIPSSLTNYPTTALTNEVKNISLGSSTSVGVTSTGSLTINGTYSNLGSTITNNGDWVMSGNATAQTLPGANGTVAAMKNLELKNTAGISLDKSFSITGTLTPTAGIINTNNATITLVSNAAGTARVAEVKAAASFTYTGSGQFAVERYHPARRAWRLMTSPLYGTGTIFDTWQNGGVYTVGKGLLVTGNPATGAAGNGLDVSAQMNFSLKTGMPITAIGNTKVPLSNNTGLGADNKGYFIFVRGDRNPLNTIIPNMNATTLSSSGKLQYGAQNFTATGTAGAYTLIGNPYASPVNFALLNKTNLANRFYTWDPKLNVVGGWVVVEKLSPSVPYVTDVASPGGQDSIIQSSQAIYVQTLTTAAASLGFVETNKSATQNFGMFRPVNALQNIPSIKSALYISNADSNVLADGNLVLFNDDFNDGVDAGDALKFININETFSLLRNGQGLAIERKKLNPLTDTVFLKLTKTTPLNYQFDFELNQLPANGQAPFLEDAFLQNATPLFIDGHTKIDFDISSDAASFNAERFRIVFKPSAIFTNVSAMIVDDNIEVKWTNSNEFDIENYEVEVSTDGINFIPLGINNSVANHQQSAAYNLVHVSPAAGIYSYRIKSTSLHGAVIYSNTVNVKMVNSKPGIIVYPNPVTNNEIHLKMNDLAFGKYQYQLYNALGQLITSGSIHHTQRFASHSIKPATTLVSGMYKLEMMDKNKKVKTVKVLVNKGLHF